MRRFLAPGLFITTLIFLGSCGQTSPYEATLASPQGVVAERYFPQDVDMLFAVDTRDETSVAEVMKLLHRYVPEYVAEGATLESVVAEYASLADLPENFSLENDILTVFPLRNRIVVGVQVEMTEGEVEGNPDLQPLKTMNPAASTMYGGIIVADLMKLASLRDRILKVEDVQEFTYHGVSYLYIPNTGEESTGNYYFVEKDLLLFSSSEAGVHKMIDTLSKKDQALLRTAFFQESMKELKERSLMTFFMNYEYVWDSMNTSAVDDVTRNMLDAIPKTEYVGAMLHLDGEGIHGKAVTSYDAASYEKLGFSMKDALITGPSVGAEIKSGQILFAAEYVKLADMSAALMNAVLPEPQQKSQMRFVANMIQNNLGLSWDEEIMPFLNNPFVLAVVDTGEVFPGITFLVDTSADPVLGEKVVAQLSAGIDKGVSFADMQMEGTDTPLPSSYYSKETIPGGHRFIANISDLAIAAVGDRISELSSGALALLKSIRFTMDMIVSEEDFVRIDMGLSSSLEELPRDVHYHEFVETLTTMPRTSSAYLGFVATAEYVTRLIALGQEYGLMTEEDFDAEALTVVNRVLDALDDFTGMTSTSLYHDDGRATLELYIPYTAQ